MNTQRQNPDAKVISVIPDLDRLSCKILLDSIGIAVYDDNATYELRDAIEANYLDGTLDGANIVMEYEDQSTST